MGSATSRIVFRIVVVALLLLLLFYIGRPLYWKISATVHDIRNNKQTVRQGSFILFLFQILNSLFSFPFFFNYPFFSTSGLSQIVIEAQKSVGWYHDESDSGVRANYRKLLLHKPISTVFAQLQLDKYMSLKIFFLFFFFSSRFCDLHIWFLSYMDNNEVDESYLIQLHNDHHILDLGAFLWVYF